ncbi:MAG: thiamine-phosphate kinase [Planctomycetota bacterium]
MREDELLQRIRRDHGGEPPAGVIIPPGDDCALVRPSGDVLLSVDQLIEGRHFDAETDADAVGRKAMARAISDIAAMAGAPLCSLVAARLRPGLARGEALSDAVKRWGERFACPVVGGDIATAEGPEALTVTVLGTPHPSRGAVRRDGAGDGQLVCVTGSIGASFESGYHLSFVPRIDTGCALADRFGASLTAMIDISDGLGIDAGRLARASGVRIELDGKAIPLRDPTRGVRRAVADGEDYELLFAIDFPSLDASVARELGFTVIGRTRPGSGCVLHTSDGDAVEIGAYGWDHGDPEDPSA